MARAGRFRHRLTIQTSSLSDPSTTGEKTRTWTDHATVWGEFRELRGRELERAQQIVAEATIGLELELLGVDKQSVEIQEKDLIFIEQSHATSIAFQEE